MSGWLSGNIIFLVCNFIDFYVIFMFLYNICIKGWEFGEVSRMVENLMRCKFKGFGEGKGGWFFD